MMRWNADGAEAAVVSDGKVMPLSYSGLLKHSTNELSRSVMGEPLHPSFRPPRQYTGKLLRAERNIFCYGGGIS